MQMHSALELDDVKAFFRGERTLAELDGMSWQEATHIAEVGCELAAMGRLEEARVIFEGLVAGNPHDSAVRAALGTVYQKLLRYEDASDEYEAALALDPECPVALAGRGELKLRQGKREGAQDLEKASSVDPHGETAAGRRAKALLSAIVEASWKP